MQLNVKEIFTQEFWRQFKTQAFWFDIDRLRLHNIDYALGLLGAILIVLAIALVVIRRTKQIPFTKALYTRYINLSMTIGIILMLWFGLRWQDIRVFGTHISGALIVLVGLIWLGVILRTYFTVYKRNLVEFEKEQQKLKYLQPKK